MANKTKNLDLIKDVFLHDNETIIYAIFGAYKTKSLGKNTIRHGVLAATDEKNNLLRKTIEWIRF